jgi:hypothetical protein
MPSGYVPSVSIAELRQLPPEEKLKIIVTLWGDLATDEASFSSPIWHGDKLKSTEVEFAAGQIEVMAWAEAKKELRQRFE